MFIGGSTSSFNEIAVTDAYSNEGEDEIEDIVVDQIRQDIGQDEEFKDTANNYAYQTNPFTVPGLSQENRNPQTTPMRIDIRYQTIEEVQSDIGELDSNSENTHSQRTSGASISQQQIMITN